MAPRHYYGVHFHDIYGGASLGDMFMPLSGGSIELPNGLHVMLVPVTLDFDDDGNGQVDVLVRDPHTGHWHVYEPSFGQMARPQQRGYVIPRAPLHYDVTPEAMRIRDVAARDFVPRAPVEADAVYGAQAPAQVQGQGQGINGNGFPQGNPGYAQGRQAGYQHGADDTQGPPNHVVNDPPPAQNTQVSDYHDEDYDWGLGLYPGSLPHQQHRYYSSTRSPLHSRSTNRPGRQGVQGPSNNRAGSDSDSSSDTSTTTNSLIALVESPRSSSASPAPADGQDLPTTGNADVGGNGDAVRPSIFGAPGHSTNATQTQTQNQDQNQDQNQNQNQNANTHVQRKRPHTLTPSEPAVSQRAKRMKGEDEVEAWIASME